MHGCPSATRRRVRGASVGAYERPRTASIAHLGVGAFMQAHLAVYADDLLRRGTPAVIRGVSLHSAGAQERLGPQDCYYAVAEREPGENLRLRVIGSLGSVSTGMPAALTALTAPSTRVVTLTITEKGYDPDPDEMERPVRPSTAAGLLALALSRWRKADGIPPVVASLDNVSGNGERLRALVTDIAARLDPALPDWISAEVRFPNSVVDRMVPATTEDDISEIAAQLGLVDLGAVTTEQHRSWIVGADEALEMFGTVGAELVDDVAPFEQRKLWLLNGPHSALAYGGLIMKRATIAAAAADARVARFVNGLVEDVLDVANIPSALEPAALCQGCAAPFRQSLPQTFMCPGRRGRLAQDPAPVRSGRRGSPAGRTRHGEVRRRRRGLGRRSGGNRGPGQAATRPRRPGSEPTGFAPAPRPPPHHRSCVGRTLRRAFPRGSGRNPGSTYPPRWWCARGSHVRLLAAE